MNKGITISTPAIAKALVHLRATLAQKSVGKLPSLAILANAARVSRNSMWKAVGIARDDGLVSVVKGGYITAARVPFAEVGFAPIEKGRGTGWRRKREMLEQDILNGVYQSDQGLPSNKELQATYGVCAATLRKILEALVAAEIVVPYKRGYRIPFVKKHRYRNTIVLISEETGLKRTGIHNERLREIIGVLESLCTRAQAHVDFIRLGEYERGGTTARAGAPATDSILGYIMNLPWFFGEESVTRVNSIVRRLAADRKPVAILDSDGLFTLPTDLASNRALCVFRLAARSAGRQVGRLLLELGHRKVGYISHLHNHTWSTQRLAGIIDQFTDAGFADAVVPITGNSLEREYDRRFWLGALKPGDIEKVLAMPIDTTLSYSQDHIYTAGKLMGPMLSSIEAFRSDLTILGDAANRTLDIDLFAAIREAALGMAVVKGGELLLEPLFQRMMAHDTVTAWMTANDGIALGALRFLERRGKRVPQDISVVGFDNTAKSFELGLTTYDFSMSTTIHRMLSFIRRPDAGRSQVHPCSEEVEGMVIERQTTGVRRARS
jgi:DNA-binding transcriptional regulator YhcF (GntR family)